MEWCQPYSGWAFPPLLSFSGKTLIGTPRSECVCLHMAKSVNSESYLSQPGSGAARHGQAVNSHVVTHYVHRMRQGEASRLYTSNGQRFPSCGLETQRAEAINVYRSLLGGQDLRSTLLHATYMPHTCHLHATQVSF